MIAEIELVCFQVAGLRPVCLGLERGREFGIGIVIGQSSNGHFIQWRVMKKVLYFDAFNGVSGDMILGALINLGVPLSHLEAELGKIHLHGYKLVADPIEREGLFGINFQVVIEPEEGGHDHPHDPADHDHSHGSGHDHHHDHSHHAHPHNHHHHHHDHEDHHSHGDSAGPHVHRTYAQIRKLIEESHLEAGVKELSLQIFENLAKAEAKVHQSDLETVHFHEVGGVDAIVDIVGAAIGFDYLGIEKFYSSPLTLGSGTVTFSHGTWPVPAPATAELIRGFPTRLGEVEKEMTTPTGAAIVTTLVDSREPSPVVEWESSGFGAGDREIPGIPNMLRLMLGFSHNSGSRSGIEAIEGINAEQLVLLEANIDDMDGETAGHFLHLAMEAGALDVFFLPAQMKKNRPGMFLSVLATPSDVQRMAELIFRETTTLGVRLNRIERWSLSRETRTVETEFGPVRVKIGKLRGKLVNLAPEYEDLRKIARETGVPLKTLRRHVETKLDGLES